MAIGHCKIRVVFKKGEDKEFFVPTPVVSSCLPEWARNNAPGFKQILLLENGMGKKMGQKEILDAY